jgi:hypothetical protein
LKPVGEEQIVDEQWLFSRGNLHDARVVKLMRSDGDFLVLIANQWSNFDRSEHPEPESGALIVKDVEGEPRVDPKALEERMMDVALVSTESGLILTMNAFGMHIIEAKGHSVVWQRFEFSES